MVLNLPGINSTNGWSPKRKPNDSIPQNSLANVAQHKLKCHSRLYEAKTDILGPFNFFCTDEKYNVTACFFYCRIFCSTSTKPNYINEPSTDFDNRLSWFTNAKYGMFIHFGLYRQHKTLVKIMK